MDTISFIYCIHIFTSLTVAQEGLQSQLHSAPGMKRKICILPTGGWCLYAHILREPGRPLPKC